MTTTKTASAPSTYQSGLCASGFHDRCRGIYAGVECTCPHHSAPPEPEPPLVEPELDVRVPPVSTVTVGELSALHLGSVVALVYFVRLDVAHRITGRLRDVWHLTAGLKSNVVLADWTADPPLGSHVSPHGGWMCRRDQPIELHSDSGSTAA